MRFNYGKLFDERGYFVKNARFKTLAKTFKYQEKAFNIDIQNGSFYDVKSLFGLITQRYFFYNISNPNPIKLDKKSEPVLNPEIYNVMLETKTAQKLNDLNKKKFNIDFKTIIIIGAIIVGGYFVLTGQVF